MRNLVWRLGLLFCPQFRCGRREYARETAGLALTVCALWSLMDPIADAEFISDGMLEVIALRGIPVVVNLLLLFMTASCARRMHDIGLSGAWGLLMLMPVFNVPVLVFALCWPGSPLPTGWRMLADVIKREF